MPRIFNIFSCWASIRAPPHDRGRAAGKLLSHRFRSPGRSNRYHVYLQGAVTNILVGLLMKFGLWCGRTMAGEGHSQCKSEKLQYELLHQHCINDDVGSTKAVVFSPKAWAVSFHALHSYLCCRLLHLPLGSIPVWTASPIGSVDLGGDPSADRPPPELM